MKSQSLSKFIDFHEIKDLLSGFARVITFNADVNEEQVDMNSIKLISFTEGEFEKGFQHGFAR